MVNCENRADCECIDRFAREYFKHGDPEQLAAFLHGVVLDESKDRATELLMHSITKIRNLAEGIEV